MCSSELRLSDSGVFPEAVVSVLLEECKLGEPPSLTSVFSACEESHGEDDVCLADKWRMMLHWSEITSLSHCRRTTETKVKTQGSDDQNQLLFHDDVLNTFFQQALRYFLCNMKRPPPLPPSAQYLLLFFVAAYVVGRQSFRSTRADKLTIPDSSRQQHHGRVLVL